MTGEKKGDRVMTPAWVAADMVAYFKPSGRVLEPFKGAGIFLSYLPSASWREIDEGRDFFDWRTPVDWIVTNPPYSKTRPCFRHAATIAREIVFLVPLRNVFSGYGFVREIRAFGGIRAIRLYGTGGNCGFPMGNAIGAMQFSASYAGPTSWSDATTNG